LEVIKKPSYMRCCRQACEEKALACWFARSAFFRMRSEHELERVAHCPLCKHMVDPAEVRDLLGKLKIPAPMLGDFCIDSGVQDPAYPTGAFFENYVLLKTSADLEAEMNYYHVPRDRADASTCVGVPGKVHSGRGVEQGTEETFEDTFEESQAWGNLCYIPEDGEKTPRSGATSASQGRAQQSGGTTRYLGLSSGFLLG